MVVIVNNNFTIAFITDETERANVDAETVDYVINIDGLTTDEISEKIDAIVKENTIEYAHDAEKVRYRKRHKKAVKHTKKLLYDTWYHRSGSFCFHLDDEMCQYRKHCSDYNCFLKKTASKKSRHLAKKYTREFVYDATDEYDGNLLKSSRNNDFKLEYNIALTLY